MTDVKRVLGRCAVVVASLGTLVTTTGAAQSPAPLTVAEVRRIDSTFSDFDHTDRPGCSLGISRQGELVYRRGYGMSNLEYGLAISPGSIFHVASISKQFTAFAIGLLVDDGKLSVDDDVRKYIPEIPSYGKPITLRHLIYHTSGIRDQWTLLGMGGWREPDVVTEGDILGVVARQKALNFQPGEEYLYSNSGYTLLGIVVKRVSGLSLHEFAEQRIFRPLGMTSTHFQYDHSMVVPNRTSAYRAYGAAWAITIPVFDNEGATSLQTTPTDLLKWEQNYVVGTVGSARLREAAMTRGSLNSGDRIPYGYGLVPETFRGVKAFGHGGVDNGYRADVIRFPESGLAVAVLCNFAEAAPWVYSRGVAAILLGSTLEPAPTQAIVTLSPGELAALAGFYRSPISDEVARVDVWGNQLGFYNWGLPLDAVGPRRFGAIGARFEFSDAGKTPIELTATLPDLSVFKYLKIEPPVVPLSALAQYAGHYWSDEVGVGYDVVLKDSVLALHRRKSDDAPLVGVFEDGFVSADALGTLHFVRKAGARGGAVTGFRLTGSRVRNVTFGRVAESRM